jgi:hypothetical protein
MEQTILYSVASCLKPYVYNLVFKFVLDCAYPNPSTHHACTFFRLLMLEISTVRGSYEVISNYRRMGTDSTAPCPPLIHPVKA